MERCSFLINGDRRCKRKTKEKYCFSHCNKLERPESCPICLESLSKENKPRSCGHWFHKHCILKWKEDTCPICREQIVFTEKERKKKRMLSPDNDGTIDAVMFILTPIIIYSSGRREALPEIISFLSEE